MSLGHCVVPEIKEGIENPMRTCHKDTKPASRGFSQIRGTLSIAKIIVILTSVLNKKSPSFHSNAQGGMGKKGKLVLIKESQLINAGRTVEL